MFMSHGTVFVTKKCLPAAVLLTILLLFLLSAEAGQQVRVGGTGGAIAIMKKLGTEFQRTHPDVRVTLLPSMGSTGGIKAVLSGALDIGVSTRPLKEDEAGAVAKAFGRTALVFATARSNPVAGLSLQEAADLYAGRSANWPDGRPVRVVLRPVSEYDTTVLKKMSTEMDKAVSAALAREGMIMAITDQDSADAIEKIPGALGTLTLAQMISEDRNLKSLSLDGVRPGTDSVRSGSYPYFKIYYLVLKPVATGAAREFADFVFSKRGRRILSESGYDLFTDK